MPVLKMALVSLTFLVDWVAVAEVKFSYQDWDLLFFLHIPAMET